MAFSLYLATVFRDSVGFLIPPRSWPRSGSVLIFMVVVPSLLFAPVLLALGLRSQLEHERQQRRLEIRGSDYAELLFPVLIDHHVDLRRGEGADPRLEGAFKRLRANPDFAAWFRASHAAFDGHLDLGQRPVHFFGVGHWDSGLAETLKLSFEIVERQSSSASSAVPASIFVPFVLFFVVPAFAWVRIVAFVSLGLIVAPLSRHRLGLLASASNQERLTMRIVLLAFVICPLIEMGATWLALGLEPGPASAALVRHFVIDPLGRQLAMGFAFAFTVAAVAVAYQFVEVTVTALLALLGFAAPTLAPFVAANGLAIGVLSLAGADAVSLGIAFSMVLVASLLRPRMHVDTGVPTILATAILLVVATIALSQLEGRSRDPAWYEQFSAPSGLSDVEAAAVRELLERTSRPHIIGFVDSFEKEIAKHAEVLDKAHYATGWE